MNKKTNIENNRFFRFFQRNKNIVTASKNFFALIGILLFIFIIIEQLLSLIISKGHNVDLAEEVSQVEGVRHHHFLDYTALYREVKNQCAEEDAITIFMYGGSTMWGVGFDFQDSIPSYLSKRLCEEEIKVEVVNYGLQGYNSTQEIIKLFLHIKNNKSPDFVIFYDGVNDIRTTIPNTPFSFMTRSVFYYYMHHQRPFSSIRGVLGNFFGNKDEKEIDFFSYDYLKNPNDYTPLIKNYENNVEIIKSLEGSYEFKSFFYWQPNLGTKKNLSIEERLLLENDYIKEFSKTYKEVYFSADKILRENENILNISDIFDEYEETIYVDDSHKLPVGNKIIAERMAEDIINHLNNKN